MPLPEDATSQLQAASHHRTTLVHVHARVLAHELSNLMFLSEIQARTPNPSAGEELRRGLPAARRLARLLADALAPEPKRRQTTVAEALEEIDTLLVRPSKGQLPRLEVALAEPVVASAAFLELTPAFLLIVQELLRQTGGKSEAHLDLRISCGGDEVSVLARGPRPLAVTPFLEVEAERNGFRVEPRGENGLLVAMPWARDGDD